MFTEYQRNRKNVRLILTKDQNMKKVCGKMVPKRISGDQVMRTETCSDSSARMLHERDILWGRKWLLMKLGSLEYDPALTGYKTLHLTTLHQMNKLFDVP